MDRISIRRAEAQDVSRLAAMEAVCFLPEEAASAEQIRDRIQHFGEYYLVLSSEGEDAAYVDAMASDEPQLRDEMYKNASLHNPNGRWLMVFGLGCLPGFRGRGYAGKLLQTLQNMARQEGREGIVLTCKEFMVPYYTRFGFVNEGRSESEHGGAVWLGMRWRNPQFMRRKDRAVTDMKEIRSYLKKMRVVHLGLCDHGKAYVIPMHYGFDEDAPEPVLYLHSAMEGRKIRILREKPECFVEISQSETPAGGKEACSWGADYICVMADGQAEMLESDEDKRHGLEVLMRHQTGCDFVIPEQGMQNVQVLKVTLTDITAKRRQTGHG